jgi:endonuclease YncB( thermonuclease family)
MTRIGWLWLSVLLPLAALVYGLTATGAMARVEPAREKVVPANAPAADSGPVALKGYIRVIDGKTLESYIGGKRVGIGLIGVDAPQGNTACGREATARLEALVKGGLELDDDPSFTFDDRFRRMYTATTHDGRSVAKELVSRGVARADKRGKERQELEDVETAAQAAQRGCVWRGRGASG